MYAYYSDYQNDMPVGMCPSAKRGQKLIGHRGRVYVYLQAQDCSRKGFRHESGAVVGAGGQQVLESQQAAMAHIPLLLLDQLVQQGQQGVGTHHWQRLDGCPHCLGCCLPHRRHHLPCHPTIIKRTSLPHVIATSRCPDWYPVMLPSNGWQIWYNRYYFTVRRRCDTWAVAHTTVLPPRAPPNVLSTFILLKGSSYLYM